jgi:hypothetical protein
MPNHRDKVDTVNEDIITTGPEPALLRLQVIFPVPVLPGLL